MASFIFALTRVSPNSHIIRFGQQKAYLLKGLLARRKYTDKMLLRIFGMRHDHVQGGEVIAADVHFRCTKERLKCLSADANIQAKDSWTVQVGDAIILLV